MGFSQSWLAVEGKPSEKILECLGLKTTGQYVEWPNAPVVGAVLPSGWYLVVANRSGHKLMRESVMKTLSANCKIITGDIEEHVMVFSICSWENGRKNWSVRYHTDREGEHLDTQGDLPVILKAVQDHLCHEAESKGIDYLSDIPAEFGKVLIGYRYDEDIAGADKSPFEMLKETKFSAENNRLSLWKRLFGT